MPISVSPLLTAQPNGVGPRYFGSSDGWPFTQATVGTASASGGMRQGNAVQMSRSGS